MTPERPSCRKFKTCRRYNDVGHSHSLTFTCFHRKAFLSKDRTRLWLIDALSMARERLHFDIWAYVIMSEHVHVLLYPHQPDYSISRILEAIKLPVTRHAKNYLLHNAPEALNQMCDRQPNGHNAYRFWQRGGGYDRNLFEPDAIHSEIEYIHNNPVRRGLVEKAEQWRWSSAGWYAGITDVMLMPDVESLPPLYPT
jgi:putative transposase